MSVPRDLQRDNPGCGEWAFLHAYRGSIAHGMYEPSTDTEEFIQRVRTDAYNATIARMWADAWAMGYEAARSDLIGDERPMRPDHPFHPAVDRLYEKSFRDLRRRAEREMTDKNAEAERTMILALGDLGRTMAQ